MSPATITPLPGGRAEFSWRGIDHTFPSTELAMAEARRRDIRFDLLPFPALSPDVLAVSPALTS
ncbi:hypothetical protein [Paractinoplanes maris]|uniref:hypothetical protein n=1 Tax=Paractinoplanes maris TaxID=1734446 RepID=UPI0020223279|nr:hypothetical protein [Actinoplanes maris]